MTARKAFVPHTNPKVRIARFWMSENDAAQTVHCTYLPIVAWELRYDPDDADEAEADPYPLTIEFRGDAEVDMILLDDGETYVLTDDETFHNSDAALEGAKRRILEIRAAIAERRARAAAKRQQQAPA